MFLAGCECVCPVVLRVHELVGCVCTGSKSASVLGTDGCEGASVRLTCLTCAHANGDVVRVRVRASAAVSVGRTRVGACVYLTKAVQCVCTRVCQHEHEPSPQRLCASSPLMEFV